MFKPGTQVRTWTGTRDNPNYIYGTVTESVYLEHTQELLYKVEWDEGGHDFLGDYELEII